MPLSTIIFDTPQRVPFAKTRIYSSQRSRVRSLKKGVNPVTHVFLVQCLFMGLFPLPPSMSFIVT